jgi:hypothetical protein
VHLTPFLPLFFQSSLTFVSILPPIIPQVKRFVRIISERSATARDLDRERPGVYRDNFYLFSRPERTKYQGRNSDSTRLTPQVRRFLTSSWHNT